MKALLYLFSVPPNIARAEGSPELTVLRNRQTTLECLSDAVPPPVITWLKNGARLQVNSIVHTVSFGEEKPVWERGEWGLYKADTPQKAQLFLEASAPLISRCSSSLHMLREYIIGSRQRFVLLFDQSIQGCVWIEIVLLKNLVISLLEELREGSHSMG